MPKGAQQQGVRHTVLCPRELLVQQEARIRGEPTLVTSPRALPSFRK